MTSTYCVRCKKETPTDDAHYETKTMQTKTGKTIQRTMLKGVCAVCGTNKTKFVKPTESQSIEPTIKGTGATYRVDKRDISKRTYRALKELIETNKAGYLTFGNTKYYVSPSNIAQFKKAHAKGVLKKAAQVMSGERTPNEVSSKIKAKGGDIDALGVLTDILGVVGMLL